MTLSASKGGIYANSHDRMGFDIDIVRYWQDIGQQKLTGEMLYQWLLQTARPAQAEIGIGNTCGLQCQHCFLGYSSGSMLNPLTPLPRLMDTMTELVTQMGTRMICVADRDALTPDRSIPFFAHLAQLRQHYPTIKFGGVTNGLFIHQYVDDLCEIHLNYLDISIDGTQHEHDLIRGQGKYDQVLTNLRLALNRQLAERIMVAITLTRFNDGSILRLIHKLITKEGVQWFDVGLLMAVKMQQYQLRERDVVEFLVSLTASLKPVKVSQPVTILMELCAYCAAFLPALIDYGWLDPQQIRQDQYGHLYQEISINSSITLILRPELISEYWRHTLRIMADGSVVGGCEPLTQSNYERESVGNIQTESISDIYTRALTVGSPFYQVMRAYDYSECRDKACFKHCLGGDALLAQSVYGSYHRKDPNCIWHEYDYGRSRPQPYSCQPFQPDLPTLRNN
jgi:MoaA/NifB/PqqE/SkfB family radical SAM enzyme